jgi:very-short-patch-repair endonuclease
LKENHEYDIGRTFELEKFEIKVVRFTNSQILNDFTNVKNEILMICTQRKLELQILTPNP